MFITTIKTHKNLALRFRSHLGIQMKQLRSLRMYFQSVRSNIKKKPGGAHSIL